MYKTIHTGTESETTTPPTDTKTSTCPDFYERVEYENCPDDSFDSQFFISNNFSAQNDNPPCEKCKLCTVVTACDGEELYKGWIDKWYEQYGQSVYGTYWYRNPNNALDKRCATIKAATGCGHIDVPGPYDIYSDPGDIADHIGDYLERIPNIEVPAPPTILPVTNYRDPDYRNWGFNGYPGYVNLHILNESSGTIEQQWFCDIGPCKVDKVCACLREWEIIQQMLEVVFLLLA